MDALDFLEHSKVLIKEIIFGFILISIFIFCILLFNSNLRPNAPGNCLSRLYLNLIRLTSFYTNYTKNVHLLTRLNLIMVFYIIFFFLCINMITSNIKTNELILDTSDLILDQASLSNTKRYACWLKTDSNYILIKNSNTNSYLHRILDEKRKDRTSFCLTEGFSQTGASIELDKVFYLMNKSTLYIFLKYTVRGKKIKVSSKR